MPSSSVYLLVVGLITLTSVMVPCHAGDQFTFSFQGEEKVDNKILVHATINKDPIRFLVGPRTRIEVTGNGVKAILPDARRLVYVVRAMYKTPQEIVAALKESAYLAIKFYKLGKFYDVDGHIKVYMEFISKA